LWKAPGADGRPTATHDEAHLAAILAIFPLVLSSAMPGSAALLLLLSGAARGSWTSGRLVQSWARLELARIRWRRCSLITHVCRLCPSLFQRYKLLPPQLHSFPGHCHQCTVPKYTCAPPRAACALPCALRLLLKSKTLQACALATCSNVKPARCTVLHASHATSNSYQAYILHTLSAAGCSGKYTVHTNLA
jgi:hypothetical protein